jgi:hypothetical protein
VRVNVRAFGPEPRFFIALHKRVRGDHFGYDERSAKPSCNPPHGVVCHARHWRKNGTAIEFDGTQRNHDYLHKISSVI